MTNVEKELIKTSIASYCKAKDITAEELAVKAGVSYSDVIYPIIMGRPSKMAAIGEKLWRKVWNVISPDVMEGLHPTADFNSVLALCDSARKNHMMFGLTGDTGMGKSTALRAYCVRPYVYYHYISPTTQVRTFLTSLLREMGVNFYGNTDDMLNMVAEELNSQPDPLLIIDESGKINTRLMLCLHSLRDKTLLNAGIVLAGMPAFKNGLIKQVSKGTNGYSEFYRRINLWHELKGLTAAEITHILEANGIKDKEEQREYRRYNRFGDLMNAITLHKTLNA